MKVSKLTVYDLVKKEELPVFRVGRQMRVDAKDLDDYIKKHKTNQLTRPSPTTGLQQNETEASHSQSIVISGQDMVLDILATQIENHSSYKTLRSFTGSLNSLFFPCTMVNAILSVYICLMAILDSIIYPM